MVKATNETERLFLKFFATLSTGNLEKIWAAFHPEAAWQVQVKGIAGEGTHRGKKEIIDEFLGPVRGMFVPGDPKVEITSLASQGDLAIGEAHGTGKFTDGRPYENLYAFAIEFKDGKVYRLREYMDSFYVARLQGRAK
jgi:ketosteroid isomerase-like protein